MNFVGAQMRTSEGERGLTDGGAGCREPRVGARTGRARFVGGCGTLQTTAAGCEEPFPWDEEGDPDLIYVPASRGRGRSGALGAG